MPAQDYERYITFPFSNLCTTGVNNTVVAADIKHGSVSLPPYNTELDYHRLVWSRKVGTVKYLPTGGLGTGLHCFGPVSFVVEDNPNWQIVLANRLATKVRGHDFNPGVTIGEGNESLGMIGSAARSMAKGAVSLEKDLTKVYSGRLSGRLKKLRIESLWLQAVYGWLPLISDIDEAMKLLGYALNRPRRETYRASLKVPIRGLSSSPINYAVNDLAGQRLYYVVAHVSESTSRNLAYTGLTNVSEIAYELTPYSFVADWFIPIGDWLQARNFLADLEATMCYGYIERAKVVEQQNTAVNFQMMSPQELHWVQHRRWAGSLPIPAPRFVPLEKSMGNWRHCVDGLALAAGAFRRIRLS